MPVVKKGSTGASEWALRRRLASGEWRELFPGVLWTGPSEPSALEWCAAALLWAGDSAVLSCRTAAWLHKLECEEEWRVPPVELIVPPARAIDAKQANVMRAKLLPVDVSEMEGLRCTTLSRTVVDLAAALGEAEFALAFESAWRSYPFVREELEAHLKEAPKRRGSRLLRKLLKDSKTRRRAFMSALEVRLWRFLAAHRFPTPKPDYPVRDARGSMFIDFAYPDRMLALETDGKEPHKERFYKDRTRWQRLEALGWSVIKITFADLKDEAFEARLKKIFDQNPPRRRRRRPAAKEVPAQ